MELFICSGNDGSDGYYSGTRTGHRLGTSPNSTLTEKMQGPNQAAGVSPLVSQDWPPQHAPPCFLSPSFLDEQHCVVSILSGQYIGQNEKTPVIRGTRPINPTHRTSPSSRTRRDNRPNPATIRTARSTDPTFFFMVSNFLYRCYISKIISVRQMSNTTYLCCTD